MNRPPGVGIYRPMRSLPRSILKRWFQGVVLPYSAGSWRWSCSGSAGPSDRALNVLRRVQRHRVKRQGQAVTGVSKIEPAHLGLFSTLGVARPTA